MLSFKVLDMEYFQLLFHTARWQNYKHPTSARKNFLAEFLVPFTKLSLFLQSYSRLYYIILQTQNQ